MITTLAAIINTLILLFLSLLHFYWAFGGKWAADKAVPKTPNGQNLFSPGPFACIVVAIFLALASMLFSVHAGFLDVAFPFWINKYGSLLIGVIFAIRALGEFKYVGFTKSITNSTFASLDSRFYSPLCLLIGLFGISIFFFS